MEVKSVKVYVEHCAEVKSVKVYVEHCAEVKSVCGTLSESQVCEVCMWNTVRK